MRVGEAALARGWIDEDVEPVLADVDASDRLGRRCRGRCHALIGILSSGQGDSREPLLLKCGPEPQLPFRSCGNCCGGRSSCPTVPKHPVTKTIRPAARCRAWPGPAAASPPWGGEILAQPVASDGDQQKLPSCTLRDVCPQERTKAVQRWQGGPSFGRSARPSLPSIREHPAAPRSHSLT